MTVNLSEWRAIVLESPGGDPGWYCAECAFAAEGHERSISVR